MRISVCGSGGGRSLSFRVDRLGLAFGGEFESFWMIFPLVSQEAFGGMNLGFRYL